MFFEGDCGIFGTGPNAGAAVSGLPEVKTVADMTTELQKAEWYVGRAYSLIDEVS